MSAFNNNFSFVIKVLALAFILVLSIVNPFSYFNYSEKVIMIKKEESPAAQPLANKEKEETTEELKSEN